MKKWLILTALLLTLLLAAGCGGDTAPVVSSKPEPTIVGQPVEEAVDALLTRDYIVGYLWYCDGLAAEEGATEDGYCAVSGSTGYTSLEDLRRLVSSTYTAEAAEALMDITDAAGQPRFVEKEGRLYKSVHPILSHYYWDYDAASITILAESESRVEFTVSMTNLHTGESAVVPLAMAAEGGKWLLEQNSIRAAEADLITAEGMDARTVAEAFTAALAANDTAAIAACAGEPADTYEAWRGMSIPAAAITDVLEEYEGYARFRVHMRVEDAFGVFGKGEEDYILILREEGGIPVVCYFEPEEETAYNFSDDRSDEACTMTRLFLQSQGLMKFQSTYWLEPAIATGYLLTLLDARDSRMIYSAEMLTAAAKQYLGLAEFTPDEGYANDEGYILCGGAPYEYNHLLIWPSYESVNGGICVKVENYTDHLNTQGRVDYLFTYRENGDGTLCLVSVK